MTIFKTKLFEESGTDTICIHTFIYRFTNTVKICEKVYTRSELVSNLYVILVFIMEIIQ